MLLSARVARIGVICDREFLEPRDPRVWKEAKTLVEAGHEVEVWRPAIFGPKGGNEHAPEEWVELASVRRVYEIYLNFLREC